MKVIVISGPTASGKTGVSLELAKKYGGEIVNFDSLLLYRELNIGTAKPTEEERGSIPHHMVNVRSMAQPMNAADYAAEALRKIQDILDRNQIVYLVGGSGFYLQAVLKGMYDSPTTPKHILERSQGLYDLEGIAPFLKILSDHDPKSYTRYHANDHYRVRRAVEHYWTHQTPFSNERAQKDVENISLDQPSIHNWDILHVHLDMPKEEHLKVIQERTGKMLMDGLEKEVRDLLAQGFIGTEKPFQSIGYKEMLAYVFGVFKTIKDCEERILISTRQLAKAQRTWFKKDTFKKTFHPLEQRSEIHAQVEKFLKS